MNTITAPLTAKTAADFVKFWKWSDSVWASRRTDAVKLYEAAVLAGHHVLFRETKNPATGKTGWLMVRIK